MPDNLYKRGSTWWGRAQVGGRRHRRSLRTTNKAEAKRRRDRWLEDLKHIGWTGEEPHTWKHAVLAYGQDVLASGTIADSTVKRYLVSLRQLEPHFQNRNIEDVTPARIAAYVRARRKDGATNATLKRDLTALSRVLSHACHQGWLQINPALLYDRTTIRETRDAIRPPTPGEVAAFVAACPPMLAKIVTILDQTGMRLEEAGGLEWQRVDTKSGEATLLKTKRNRPRVVPLNPIAVATILATPRHLHSTLVFNAPSGGRLQNLSSRLAGIKRRKGLIFRTHDLRHKFGIDYLREHGEDSLPTLSRIMGHSSVKTTEMYVAYINPEGTQNRPQRRGIRSDTEVE